MVVNRSARAWAATTLMVLVSGGCTWVGRVSVGNAGNQANDGSDQSTISADGHYIAFSSQASNLVPGDTNGYPDVFVRDTVAGTTTRVSVDSTGTQGNGLSGDPAISADGHYVAFQSGASNLVTGDTNEVADVFVRDTVAGTTIRVNVDSAGTQADLAGLDPAILADGYLGAFASLATNMVAGDTDPWIDVFVRNIVAGTTSRLSVDSAGNHANGGSLYPAISADGTTSRSRRTRRTS